MENTEVAARGDYSIAELRTMVTTGDQPAEKPAASDANDAVPVEGAAAAEPTETEPDSGTETEQEGDKQERGPDGKFKPKTEEDDDTPGVKKRIGKVLEKQRQAEQRAAAAERKLAELQGSRPGTDGAKTQQQPAAQNAKAKPELKDYDTYEKYNEDLVTWTVEQREAEREQRRQEASRKAAEQTVQQAHQTRIEAAKAAHPDWDEKIGELNVPISRELHNAIVESELGPEVVYYCATHPEEARRISALSPARQVVEFGKLEARIEAAAAPADKKAPAKKVLPKPAANVAGGATAGGKAPDLSDPNLPMAAFKREVSRRMKRSE